MLSACSPSTPAPTAAPPSDSAASASPSSSAATGARASATSGAFRLDLVVPRADWKSDEPITGKVILSYAGPVPTMIYGSAGLISFRYAEIGGPHNVEPVSTNECGTYEADPATPMDAPPSKS